MFALSLRSGLLASSKQTCSSLPCVQRCTADADDDDHGAFDRFLIKERNFFLASFAERVSVSQKRASINERFSSR